MGMTLASSSREQVFSHLLHVVADRYWKQRKRSHDLIDAEGKAFLASIDYAEEEFLDFVEDSLGIGEDILAVTLRRAGMGEGMMQSRAGYMYQYGFGAEKNYAEAAVWYRKAAEQGVISSQYTLAYFYANGLGVAQDNAQAIHWYRQAAARGSEYAQAQLGWHYCYGQGVDADPDQARFWWNKAAAQGNSRAKEELRRLEAGPSTEKP